VPSASGLKSQPSTRLHVEPEGATITRSRIASASLFRRTVQVKMSSETRMVLDPPSPSPPKERILSVDALRGFDMFWIVGGNDFVIALLAFCGSGFRKTLLPQLHHVDWEGFAFHDLIFPLFVFLVGMTTVFSLSKCLLQHGKKAAYWRLCRRTAILFLLGVFYYGGMSNAWPGIRLAGVLQRIALCCFFSGIVFIHCRLRGILITLALLLAGYWTWMSFVPVPSLSTSHAAKDQTATDHRTPRELQFAENHNWAWYIDSQYLIGKRAYGTWDPEGILSTFPAVATCLLGVLAAMLLRNVNVSDRMKVCCMLGSGILMAALGYAWGLQFPVIKKIWTSSYVLVAGGYSCILLGAFYLVVDVWKFRRWAAPFVWIGTNAITIYVAVNVIPFGGAAKRLVGGNVQTWVGHSVGELLLSGTSLALVLIFAGFLHRHKIFLRV
jgi:predicted acyltransferase